MTDIIDHANELAEQLNSAYVKHARSASNLKKIGRCHNCEAELKNEALFCDIDCRDDYEHRAQAHKRAGIKQV